MHPNNMHELIIGTLNSPNMYSTNVELPERNDEHPERNDEHPELCKFYNSPDHYQIDLLTTAFVFNASTLLQITI